MLSSFSQGSQKHIDSILVPIESIKAANSAFVELMYMRRIDTLQKVEIESRKLESYSLRVEIMKLKENDAILNKEISFMSKIHETDSTRIMDLTNVIKKQNKDKILIYSLATPAAFIVGTAIGILVKTFAVR